MSSSLDFSTKGKSRMNRTSDGFFKPPNRRFRTPMRQVSFMPVKSVALVDYNILKSQNQHLKAENQNLKWGIQPTHYSLTKQNSVFIEKMGNLRKKNHSLREINDDLEKQQEKLLKKNAEL